MKDPGPDRRETRLYLILSLGGLAILVAAVLLGGIADFGSIKVVGLAGLFFAGTAAWAARRLWRMR